jgi:aldehyde:ferredoxin oxidoreductase
MKSTILEINLSKNEITESFIDTRSWIGGRGLAVKLFTDRVDPGCDPLDAENVMVFAVSPLTGTSTPTAGRGHAVFKSPLTGVIGSSNSGGHWGKVFKSTGYDALVLTGAASKPVYITISDRGNTVSERVKITDASDLWGRKIPDATESLINRHGKKTSVLTIGSAGENKVRFASMMNECNRAFGRGGPGAVLGSKNVKAILVNGEKKTPVAEPGRFADILEQTRRILKVPPTTKSVLRELGTAGLVQLVNVMGMLPHRNFIDCTHDLSVLKNISGEAITEKILVKAGACYGCPIACQRHTKVDGKTGEGPEFETVVLMGALLDIYDLNAITLANYAANESGIDTMTLGGTLACAAELYEAGALSKADIDGLDLKFGNTSIYPEIVEIVSTRSGIGDLLAEGSRRFAQELGYPNAAMHVKGLEIPAYDPRGMHAQALGYMTSPTGACHLRGGYSILLAYFGGIREVPRFSIRQAAMTAKNQQDLGIIQDSVGVCRFTGFAAGVEYWTKTYASVTGEDVDREEMEQSAERIATLERIFNLKAGITRSDDNLPERFKNVSIKIDNGDRLISDSDRNRMLDDYYSIRGWDSDGIPLKKTCEKLEIDYC